MSSPTSRPWSVVILSIQAGFVAVMGLLFSGIIGPWSLPLGIAAPLLGFGAFVTSLWGWRQTKENVYVLIAALWIFFPAADLRIHSLSAKGTPIMTWNIAKPSEDRFRCALDALTDWTQAHPKGLLFLQEITRAQNNIVEQKLGLTCIWKPYLSSCNANYCNGLQICAPSEWTFSRTGHRDFKQQGTYGFLQSELNHTPTGHTINALNIHLESLYSTNRKLPEDSSSVTVLHHNAQAQTEQVEQMQRIFSLLKDPILLVGDFNSPSSMWHHRALRRQLKDAHRSTGLGWGWTRFKGYLPLRIDYMYSSAPLQWTAPTRVNYDIACSDHYPIESAFHWE